MNDLWSDLLDCLEMSAPDFEGRNQKLGYHRIFGGQLLAQFVQTAALALPEKSVRSIHVLFARAGMPDERVRYAVSCHHDGGTFATLTILARQRQGVIATAAVSMHAAEEGLDQQAASHVPAVPGQECEVDLGPLPWETRSVDDLDAAEPSAAEFEFWMRTPPVDPSLAPSLAAYATDLTLIGTALKPLEGVGHRDAGSAFTSAVTSHTVSFHRPFRTDDWLLLRQNSPVLAHGRCYGRGDILTANGVLVASYAQEAMVRFRA